MKIALYFSGRIRGYEFCIDKIMELKDKYDIVCFCSLNLEKLTDYERNFCILLDMLPDQYVYGSVVPPERISEYNTGDKFTIRENLYSQLYNNKRCMDMIAAYEKKNNQQFDMVVKYRADILSSTTLPIPQEVEQSTLYIPNSNIHSGMNDQVGYGSRETMRVYSDVIDDLEELCGTGTFYHPESLLLAQMRRKGIRIVEVDFAYGLHSARFW
jgi:hypothetical protein